MTLASGHMNGTVVMEIRFPEKDLIFQEIRGADSEKATVSAILEKDPQEPGKTLLRVTMESKAGALETGIVGKLKSAQIVVAMPPTSDLGCRRRPVKEALDVA